MKTLTAILFGLALLVLPNVSVACTTESANLEQATQAGFARQTVMTGLSVSQFLDAYAKVFSLDRGNIRSFDRLEIFTKGETVFLLGYEDGCLLGFNQMDDELLLRIYQTLGNMKAGEGNNG